LLNVWNDGILAVCYGGQMAWHFVMTGHDACNVRGAKCAYDRNEKTSHTEMVELTQLFSWYNPSPNVV